MTPDEARALLDGTTPGPWFFDDDMAGTVYTIGPIMSCGNELDCTTDDAALAAHAPTLAAMIAGMREEWGVEMETNTGWHHWTNTDGRAPWFATREHAENAARLEPNPTRIVRRYVTTPEEA